MRRTIGVLVMALLVLGTASQAFAQSKRQRRKPDEEGCGCGQEKAGKAEKAKADKRQKAQKIDKEWLKSLPPERRKQALLRLKQMKPEDRSRAIERFKQDRRSRDRR